jgi:hypothetical protein
MSALDKPFPGDWYAEADRPSSPSMRRIGDCVKAGVCIDCGGAVETVGFWWCGTGRCTDAASKERNDV